MFAKILDSMPTATNIIIKDIGIDIEGVSIKFRLKCYNISNFTSFYSLLSRHQDMQKTYCKTPYSSLWTLVIKELEN